MRYRQSVLVDIQNPGNCPPGGLLADCLGDVCHFMLTRWLGDTRMLAIDPYPRTPAMVGGLTNHIWTHDDAVALGTT